MSSHDRPKAIGGKLFDPTMKTLLAVFGISAVVMVYRFFTGMGTVSNMTDGYAWGIWEPVNVVVFTGVGAGAYGVGFLCYALNRGKYHGLVRPAVLLGAIAYTLGGSSIMVALGRYWNSYWLAVPWFWNLNSVLLEVAICVITYVCVLWIEVLPAVCDGAAASRFPIWRTLGKRCGGYLVKAMPFIIALALLLPTMHQSSLGGLYLIAGPKTYPLWHTKLLPLLFLISCLSMGYGAVVVLTNILNLTWKAKYDQQLFAEMSKVNALLLILYSVLRVGDLAVHNKLKYLLVFDFHLFWFLLEMALFIAPAILFFSPQVQQNRGRLFSAALMALFAGALYRVDTYLTAYNPGDGWDYLPSFGEVTITVGMAAIGMAVFIFVSRLFPVVVVDDSGSHPAADADRIPSAAS